MTGERGEEENPIIGDILDFLKKREVEGKKFSQHGEEVSEEEFEYEIKKPHLKKLFEEKFNYVSNVDPREGAESFKGTYNSWLIGEAAKHRKVGDDELVNIVENITIEDGKRYLGEKIDEDSRSMGRTDSVYERNTLDKKVKKWSYWAMVAHEASILGDE